MKPKRKKRPNKLLQGAKEAIAVARGKPVVGTRIHTFETTKKSYYWNGSRWVLYSQEFVDAPR